MSTPSKKGRGLSGVGGGTGSTIPIFSPIDVANTFTESMIPIDPVASDTQTLPQQYGRNLQLFFKRNKTNKIFPVIRSPRDVQATCFYLYPLALTPARCTCIGCQPYA